MTTIGLPVAVAAPAVTATPPAEPSMMQNALGAGNAPGVDNAPGAENLASRNLTQYLAEINPATGGASPAELGRHVVSHLQGFFDRANSMASQARALTEPSPAPHADMTLVHRGPAQEALVPSNLPVGPQAAPPGVDGSQMDRAIQRLSQMFDYGVEMQIVVRGATQVSGAANTLLRG